MEQIANFNKGDTSVDLSALKDILGFDPKNMVDKETGKIETGMMTTIMQTLMNKLSERVTMMSNLMKSSNDLFQALNSNMRVA